MINGVWPKTVAVFQATVLAPASGVDHVESTHHTVPASQKLAQQ